VKHKYAIRYAIVGAIFGMTFPIIGTIVDTLHYQLPLVLDSFIKIQAENPLHWIIDTAPLVLGFMASMAGVRQDRLSHLNEQLEAEIDIRRKAYLEIEELKNTLEEEVKERTISLERKAKQLQAATDVGHASATIRDLDTLLKEVTQLISTRFDFYHVGIFLLDKDPEYVILRASNSPGGEKMLARGHRLKIGQEGIVGYVSAQREPRIALDVGQDAVFFDNPDLPETRSELALPLIVGDKLLGALDVQSKREAAFKSDDISTLQALADQVAIAIENARLFTEYQSSLEATRRAFGERSQASWNEYLQTESEVGFLSTLAEEIQTISDEWTPGMIAASQRGEIVQVDDQTIAIPIILRDQVLGVVRLQKPVESSTWAEDEITLMDTLVDQLEVALESARLYKDTQQRAQRERMVTEITTKIRASTDPQTMLQTAVSELRDALQAQRAQMVIQAESKK